MKVGAARISASLLRRWNSYERAQAAQGPSFSVRPEKEAKGAVLHGTSAAERLRHVASCSAGRTKNSPPHGAQTICAPVFSPRETR